MKIEFSSQRREMLLFLTTNMAAVTSRANQQSTVSYFQCFSCFISIYNDLIDLFVTRQPFCLRILKKLCLCTASLVLSTRLAMLQYSSQIVETAAICLEFSPNFLLSLLTSSFSLKFAPLLPQCWATRILDQWDDCNTQINIGEGENHTSVSRFMTRIVDGKKGSERGRSGATKSSSFLPFNHPLLSLLCALRTAVRRRQGTSWRI